LSELHVRVNDDRTRLEPRSSFLRTALSVVLLPIHTLDLLIATTFSYFRIFSCDSANFIVLGPHNI
jgi:hypothetical protein